MEVILQRSIHKADNKTSIKDVKNRSDVIFISQKKKFNEIGRKKVCQLV